MPAYRLSGYVAYLIVMSILKIQNYLLIMPTLRKEIIMKRVNFTEISDNTQRPPEDLVATANPDEILYTHYLTGQLEQTAVSLAQRFEKVGFTASELREHIAARRKEFTEQTGLEQKRPVENLKPANKFYSETLASRDATFRTELTETNLGTFEQALGSSNRCR